MAPRRKDAALDASSAEPQAQRAAPPAQAGLGGSPPGGAEYADLTRRHRLPPLWRPGVAPPALLSAENELRYLYQTGRAGSDSARIRLYLAEAARIRYAEAPDSALHEAIVHHYLRAIRLARSDSGAAQVARERLDSFTR